MKPTTFNIAFLVYVATCAVLCVLCVVFMLVDDRHGAQYSNIVVFIIGKFTGFLVAREGKSRASAAVKALTHSPDAARGGGVVGAV